MQADVLVTPVAGGDAEAERRGEISERAVDGFVAGDGVVRGIVTGHADAERAVGREHQRDQPQPERLGEHEHSGLAKHQDHVHRENREREARRLPVETLRVQLGAQLRQRAKLVRPRPQWCRPPHSSAAGVP
jgi:hypothetical protein